MPAPVARGSSRAHQDAHDGRADGKGKGKAHASASARASASGRDGPDVAGVDRKPVKAELEDTSIHVPPGVRGDVIVLSDDDDDDIGVGVVSVSRPYCTVVLECTVLGVADFDDTCVSRDGRLRSSATQTGEQLTTRTM